MSGARAWMTRKCCVIFGMPPVFNSCPSMRTLCVFLTSSLSTPTTECVRLRVSLNTPFFCTGSSKAAVVKGLERLSETSTFKNGDLQFFSKFFQIHVNFEMLLKNEVLSTPFFFQISLVWVYSSNIFLFLWKQELQYERRDKGIVRSVRLIQQDALPPLGSGEKQVFPQHQTAEVTDAGDGLVRDRTHPWTLW